MITLCSLENFLLVLIELFSLSVTAEALRANIGLKSAISLQRGPVDRNFRVEEVAPATRPSTQKTKLNNLSYGIKIWRDLSSVLSQSTRLTDGRTDGQTDRQTNGQTEFSSLDRVCIPWSAVKIKAFLNGAMDLYKIWWQWPKYIKDIARSVTWNSV